MTAAQIDLITGMAAPEYVPRASRSSGERRARVNVQGRDYYDVSGVLVPADMVRENPVKIRRASDVLPFLAHLRTSAQEVFTVLTLDGNHQVIKAHDVTRGLVNQSQVHPRETFKPAILDSAVGVIIAHNHPSGNPDPSGEDIAATRRLAEAGRLLGIPVLDHLIITATEQTSIRERFPEAFTGK